jgi:hypothetical protein
MATNLILCDRLELIKLGGGLASNELPMRVMFAFPHVIEWIENDLPELGTDLSGGKQSPLEQLDLLLYDFISGEDLDYYKRSHSMRPEAFGVWELKTPDVRVFGWFQARNVFIIANIDSAFRCKEHDLYTGFRNDTVRRRDLLDLDEPKFILGGYDDVF